MKILTKKQAQALVPKGLKKYVSADQSFSKAELKEIDDCWKAACRAVARRNRNSAR